MPSASNVVQHKRARYSNPYSHPVALVNMPRISPDITDVAVRKLSDTGKRYDKRFRKGLEVRVYPGGTKVFQFVYQSPLTRKRRRMSLGTYDKAGKAGLTVAEASAMADEARKMVMSGQDPQHAREAEQERLLKQFAEEQNSLTVAKLVDQYLSNKKGIKEKTLSGYEGSLRLYVLPALGAVKAEELTQRQIRNFLYELVNDDMGKRANESLKALKVVYSWANESGMLEYHPVLGIKKPVPAESRDRILSEREIVLLWRSLSAPTNQGSPPPFTDDISDALKLLLLTGQRSGEIRLAQWENIDLQSRVWTIPKEITKTGKGYAIPITPLAAPILEKREACRRNEYLFPGRGDVPHFGRTTFSHAVRRWHNSDQSPDFDQPKWNAHDLRRTLRTQLAKLGIDNTIAELTINHSQESLVQVYNRHTYEAEVAAALMKWDARLTQLIGAT